MMVNKHRLWRFGWCTLDGIYDTIRYKQDLDDTFLGALWQKEKKGVWNTHTIFIHSLYVIWRIYEEKSR